MLKYLCLLYSRIRFQNYKGDNSLTLLLTSFSCEKWTNRMQAISNLSISWTKSWKYSKNIIFWRKVLMIQDFFKLTNQITPLNSIIYKLLPPVWPDTAWWPSQWRPGCSEPDNSRPCPPQRKCWCCQRGNPYWRPGTLSTRSHKGGQHLMFWKQITNTVFI